jgi:hypothetical protein
VARADYVHDVDATHTLPPILYPGKIMNAAVNFYTHACEEIEASIEGIGTLRLRSSPRVRRPTI